MIRGVDSGEKTLHTTSSNDCKFSRDSKARSSLFQAQDEKQDETGSESLEQAKQGEKL